jgi:hypothetical protein
MRLPKHLAALSALQPVEAKRRAERAATPERVLICPILSPIGPHAIAAGCDQGAGEHGEGDAKENFAAYH